MNSCMNLTLGVMIALAQNVGMTLIIDEAMAVQFVVKTVDDKLILIQMFLIIFESKFLGESGGKIPD